MDPANRPILETVEDRLEARWPDDRRGTGITVDFSAMRFPHGADAVRGMPLVRACGADLARQGARLVDATAGLGYDAFVLALAGFEVVAFERSAEVFRLLEDGVRRAAPPRLRVRHGDARDALAELAPHVVYLDPMYPEKRRASALPPKEMQVVRALVGDDRDSDDLLAAAMAVAERVVVKRPLHAPSLADGHPAPHAAPHHTIAGKLARFDVYECPRPRGGEEGKG